MLFSTLLILGSFTGAFSQSLGISSESRVLLRRAPRHTKPNLQLRHRKTHKQHSRLLNLPIIGTRVSSSTTSQSYSSSSTTSQSYSSSSYSQQTTRTNFFLNKQIYSYFQECHTGVVGHVQRITDICAGQITAENAKSIAWELLAELQAILVLCIACARKVKSCGSLSMPSNVPNDPTTSQNFSVQQIGELVFQIISQLKICFCQMNKVCSHYEEIRSVCSDCLVQISSSASEFLSTSSVHVGGLLSVVNNFIPGNVESFFGLRVFGLASIFQVFNS